MSTPITISIDLANPDPVYRQIVDGVRALIVEGKLQPEDQLPTVRQLAIDLGIHHNTVAEAYRQLAAEGWLDLRRRRGAMVQQRPDPKPTKATKEQFEKRLRELTAFARAQGLTPKTIAEILERSASDIGEI